MRFYIVTCAAFTALIVATIGSVIDGPTGTMMWVFGLLAEAVLFPYFGYLLGRRTRSR
jgi:hypothetical protein